MRVAGLSNLSSDSENGWQWLPVFIFSAHCVSFCDILKNENSGITSFSDHKKHRKQGTHGNLLHHTDNDPRGLAVRGGHSCHALSDPASAYANRHRCATGVLTFGLHVEFDPELFLVLFIPPLLFADGWKTPTREFLEHGREIFGLALALVVVTVVGIGFLIYWVVPGIPLIPAFALAAVLSPTDAVALSGIVGEGRIPKKSWAFCRAKR